MTNPFAAGVAVSVGGRDPIQLLKYEASRRPDLQALCERAHELSDSDIEVANLPLPWMRKALSLLRDRAVVAHARNLGPALDLTLRDFIVDGRVPDPEGMMWEYRGETRFVPAGRSSLEVPEGKLIFVCAGRVFMDTAEIQPDDRFMARSVPLRSTTKTGYAGAVQERLQRLFPDAPMTVCAGGQTAASGRPDQPLAHLGVRIQR